ncbi:MAG: ankyrin repeat domain-containing protein [Akkermansia sp.]|nr:ankyrin repeat domain-containing protein [Akkermansia sp.]
MTQPHRTIFVAILGTAALAALCSGVSSCTKSPQITAPVLSVNQAKRVMFQAVKKDNPRLLRRALQMRPDVNQTDESGYTPLLLASRWGNSSCVKLLLNAPGIDINKAVDDGETPLYKAAAGGHSACVRLLLQAPGIDVNKAENSYGWTPLTVAAIEGQEDCFRRLLRAPDININKKDLYGVNVLFHSAFNGYRDGVKRLLSRGIDTSAYDAAVTAIFRNDVQELNRRIADGYNVNTKGIYRMTPLLWAAGLGREDCVRILLRAGADASTPGSDSRTPLIRAASYGHEGSVRLLLAAPGINPNQTDEDGETPLGHAAYAGHADCIRRLLSAPDIDVNKVNNMGETPLFLAAWQGHTDSVRALLTHPGIDLLRADKNGNTPLQIAETSGNDECVLLLRNAMK